MPNVAGRLFNLPTKCWQPYTLAAGANLSLAFGLSAESIFALQCVYSGYGSPKSLHFEARSGISMGILANALREWEATGDTNDEIDAAVGDELRETGTAAPFRAVPVGTVRVAAAAGGAGPGQGVPFRPSTVPEEVPSNL